MIFSTTVDEKRDSLIKLARSVADVPGEAAECGVFLGGCLRAIAEALPDKMVFGFDTFTGLPEEARGYGDLHPAGEFSATSIEVVRDNVAGLTNIILVPGIFPSRCEHLEHYSFAFVYLDFDFYVSTRDAISWFLPRMTPGGIMVFDDYDCDYCPGVRRAIEEAGIEIEHTVQTQVVHRS